jgi:hypothetical protein
MLRSPAVWGQFVADWCVNWFGHVALTFLPQYLLEQLGYDLQAPSHWQ